MRREKWLQICYSSYSEFWKWRPLSDPSKGLTRVDVRTSQARKWWWDIRSEGNGISIGRQMRRVLVLKLPPRRLPLQQLCPPLRDLHLLNRQLFLRLFNSMNHLIKIHGSFYTLFENLCRFVFIAFCSCMDRPRPFNCGFRICLQKLCLSSVHPMSSSWYDIGCTEDKNNFWRQIRNPQLKGRGLCMGEYMLSISPTYEKSWGASENQPTISFGWLLWQHNGR